ncbi:MAG: aspartate aminotransferase family protein [Acidobacteria bacterium]|nr:aspartate aminotransferase family protein [Acidobacteriota bacterium]
MLKTETRNAELFAEGLEYIPGGVNSSTRALDPPLVFTKAVGSMLYDADGKAYIDFHAAFGPILLGHSHPAVNRKVIEAVESLDLVGVGTTDLEIRLAAKLCRCIPSAEKVLFCNSGSEATYNAVRLARAVTGKKKLIKFQGCYHGWHDYLCMNIISPAEKIGRYDPGSTGMLAEAIENTIVLTFNRIDEVEATLRREGDQVAAIILEPIPHNIGCVLPRPEFLPGLRELATQHGVILIFDEVITGFRHGLGGYQGYCGVTPDLTTVAKAMANGYPCATLCGKRELMDRFQTGGGDVFFAGTYNGHPVGMAAPLATIEELEDGRVHRQLFANGAMMARELSGLIKKYGVKAHVAQFGSVFVVYFQEPPVETYTDLLRNDREKDVRFRREMVERGFFLLPLALKRNNIMASHTGDELGRTLEAAEEVFKRLR